MMIRKTGEYIGSDVAPYDANLGIAFQKAILRKAILRCLLIAQNVITSELDDDGIYYLAIDIRTSVQMETSAVTTIRYWTSRHQNSPDCHHFHHLGGEVDAGVGGFEDDGGAGG